MAEWRYYQILIPCLVAVCIGIAAAFALHLSERERNSIAGLPPEAQFVARIVSVEHRGWQSFSPRRHSRVDTYFRLQSEDGREVEAHCHGRQSPSLLDQTVTVIVFDSGGRHSIAPCVDALSQAQLRRLAATVWLVSAVGLIVSALAFATVRHVRRMARVRAKSWISSEDRPRPSVFRRAVLRDRGERPVFGRK